MPLPTAPPPRPPGRTWWAIGCLVLTGCWLALVLFEVSSSRLTTATVERVHGDGSCTVSWSDPTGRVHRVGSDCSGEPPGSPLRVLVDWTAPGAAVTTPAGFAVDSAVVAGPLVAVGGLRLLVVARHRARQRSAGPSSSPGVPLGAAPGASTAPARSFDRTATALRRAFRGVWALTALGVVCAVVFMGLLGVMARADGELRLAGARAEGTLLRVDPDTATSRGGASVGFAVAGEDLVRHVDLGAYADSYVPGDAVVVWYDPADPSRVTVDDVAYDPPGTTWPAVLAFVGVLFSPVLAVWTLAGVWRTDRLLSQRPWQQVRVSVTEGHGALLFRTPDGTVWRSTRAVAWSAPDREPCLPSDGDLSGGDPDVVAADHLVWWVAGGRAAVFSPDGGHPLVLARRRRQDQPRGPSHHPGGCRCATVEAGPAVGPPDERRRTRTATRRRPRESSCPGSCSCSPASSRPCGRPPSAAPRASRG
ncbi:hypothetical protein SAMN05660464_2455 [Geodermatophilus dictyosporus]|uniref:DUF3592 domain-containing protein n=1 Tax=Geodermatophilus dictyosporus TaxID=1523247 RepID=A0A1I5NDP6_9ACTN|nr:hypothetical protein SAMN05660464_2455 [Geodermatophilus dictyosporus]